MATYRVWKAHQRLGCLQDVILASFYEKTFFISKFMLIFIKVCMVCLCAFLSAYMLLYLRWVLFFERLFNLNYIYVCCMGAQSRMLRTMELELPADVSCPLWVLELHSAPLQEQ